MTQSTAPHAPSQAPSQAPSIWAVALFVACSAFALGAAILLGFSPIG